MQKAAAAIHANSDVLVTVGLGMIKYNSDSSRATKYPTASFRAF